MRIWAVDADDASDADESLLHLTPALSTFLESANTSRFLVIGAKGIGKTLLLRTKRSRLEKLSGGMYLPENSLSDKPLGLAPAFSRGDMKRIRKSPSFWSDIWLMSITLAAIKVARHLADTSVLFPTATDFKSEIGELFAGKLHSITDLFTRILTFSASQHAKARRDLQRHLGPAFRSIRAPIVAFIDNVDEHFNAHLQATDRSGDIFDKSVWYDAQTGLATAVRELRPQNQNVRVYASIRAEAIAQLLHDKELSQDLYDVMLPIEYDAEDLKQIFIRNLHAETDVNCVEPNATDPFQRFFGSENLTLEHLAVGELEEIWQFVLRHTLGRPRDLMTIGSRLSAVRPSLRSRPNVRRAVDDAAGSIAAAYVGQISGHLSNEIDFPLLFKLINRNILTRHELEAIAATYNERLGAREKPVHVFCALYKAGLLGYVTRDVGTGELWQRFEKPATNLFAPDGVLPRSTHYVVHPVLDARIRLLAPEYAHDTLNIAGDGRLWRDAGVASGVVKADVVGYSRILQNPELSKTFPDDFEAIVRECGRNLAFHKLEGGDTVWLEDPNAAKLLRTLRDISQRLVSSHYRAQLRAGAEYGPTRASQNLVYRTAARLEAVSAPNILCATREFSEHVCAIDRRVAFGSGESLVTLQRLERQGQAHNIRKSEADPDLYREIRIVELT